MNLRCGCRRGAASTRWEAGGGILEEESLEVWVAFLSYPESTLC